MVQTGGESVVSFADPNLKDVLPNPAFRKLINKELKQPEDAPISAADMAKLERLSISFTGTQNRVSNIEGIEYAVNLKHLSVFSATAQQLEPIKKLTWLSSLEAQNCKDFDLSLLQNMENLTKLSFHGCAGFSDLTKMGKKPKLTQIEVQLSTDAQYPLLKSLNGLNPTDFPALINVTCYDCRQLTDISALSQFTTLKTVDLTNSNVSDITPLKGNSQLTELSLVNVRIKEQNRQQYKETIKGLTGLQNLNMRNCSVTDADTDMFAPLTNLKQLTLSENQLTSVDFCNQLTNNIQKISLYENNITNMDNFPALPNLSILDFGNNNITKFQFITKLPKLTNQSEYPFEGTENNPALETFVFSTNNVPTQLPVGSTTMVLDNPFVGLDGKPISFATYQLPQNAKYTFRYDADKNQLIFENLTQGTGLEAVSVWTSYQATMPDGKIKHFKCMADGFVQIPKEQQYTVSYDCDNLAPEGQKLPTDTNTYNTADDAKAAMDKTISKQTTIVGNKDNRAGIWTFSGWTAKAEGTIVKFIGNWSFTETPVAPTPVPPAPTTPPTNSPTVQTGDAFTLAGLGGLLSLSGMAAFLANKKRKQKKNGVTKVTPFFIHSSSRIYHIHKCCLFLYDSAFTANFSVGTSGLLAAQFQTHHIYLIV